MFGVGFSSREGQRREGSAERKLRKEQGSVGERVGMRLFERGRAGAGKGRAEGTRTEMRSWGRTGEWGLVRETG